jgi:hypothetical protein
MWAYALHPELFPEQVSLESSLCQIALETIRKTTTAIAETPTSRKNPRNAAATFCPLPTLTGWLHPTGFAERCDLAWVT